MRPLNRPNVATGLSKAIALLMVQKMVSCYRPTNLLGRSWNQGRELYLLGPATTQSPLTCVLARAFANLGLRLVHFWNRCAINTHGSEVVRL